MIDYPNFDPLEDEDLEPRIIPNAVAAVFVIAVLLVFCVILIFSVFYCQAQLQ